MGKIGLLNPIIVRQKGDGFEVVGGSHRLQAAELLGWTEIDAIVIEASDVLAELAMIDENLCRAELSPADRAQQTARRKAIYLELHPETGHGGDRSAPSRQLGDLPAADRFTAETAKISGASERAVQRDAERGEKVISAAFDIIKGTHLDTGTYLDKLKRLSPSEQVVAAKRDLAFTRQQQRENAQNGISRRYVRTADAPRAAEDAGNPKLVEDLAAKFMAGVSMIEAIPVEVLIAEAGSNRARIGQRASGLIDRLTDLLERLDP